MVPVSTKVPREVLVSLPVPDTRPDKVNCAPESTLMELLAARSTVPDKLPVPDWSRSVPPFKVIASAPTLKPTVKNRLAPLATDVPAPVPPNPDALVMAKVPADTVVAPV